jgi:glycosyltransferase involved in cell wall biosynthesis
MVPFSDAHPAPSRDDEAWVVIPLYNEATVIASVITELLEVFSHVVCIDDGSTDGSGDVAKHAGARVLRHPYNLGQGAALQTGISYVQEQPDARYIVTFDADGQHRIVDAIAMVHEARERDLAIVFGSRFLDARTNPGRVKKVVLKTAVWVTNRTTGLRLTDAHNGLRVIRLDAARRVNLQQDRMPALGRVPCRGRVLGLLEGQGSIGAELDQYPGRPDRELTEELTCGFNRYSSSR